MDCPLRLENRGMKSYALVIECPEASADAVQTLVQVKERP